MGFSPQLFGTFENGRVEQWLEMRALEPQEMAAQQPTDFVSMIGRELARMHALDMPFVKTPKLWGTLHSWLAMATALHFDCPDKAARHRALRLRHLAAELAYLERRLPSPANGFDPALLFGAARVRPACLRRRRLPVRQAHLVHSRPRRPRPSQWRLPPSARTPCSATMTCSGQPPAAPPCAVPSA